MPWPIGFLMNTWLFIINFRGWKCCNARVQGLKFGEEVAKATWPSLSTFWATSIEREELHMLEGEGDFKSKRDRWRHEGWERERAAFSFLRGGGGGMLTLFWGGGFGLSPYSYGPCPLWPCFSHVHAWHAPHALGSFDWMRPHWPMPSCPLCFMPMLHLEARVLLYALIKKRSRTLQFPLLVHSLAQAIREGYYLIILKHN